MTAVLYELMYVITVCLTSVLLAGPYMNSTGSPRPLFLCALITIAVCTALRHLKGKYRYLIPGMITALLLGVAAMQPEGEKLRFITANLRIINAVILSAFCYFAGLFLASCRIVRRIAAPASAAGLIASLFLKDPPGKTETALILFLLVLVTADEVQYFRNKNKDTDPKAHMVSLAPVFIITGLIIFLSPAPDSPYDWAMAKKLCTAAVSCVKTVERLFHGQNEDYGGLTGFSENGTIGGSLRSDDRTVMYVSFMTNAGSLACLKGKTLDSFDGREWTGAYTSPNHDAGLETLETMCAILKNDPDHISDYVKEAALSLRYDDFNTGYLFTPGRLLYISGLPDENTLMQLGGDIKTDELLGYGTEYSVRFMRLNENEEVLRQLTDPDKAAIDAASWKAAKKRYGQGETGISYEDYMKYRKRIYSYYLPDTPVSSKTEQLLDDLEKGADTDYEKLKRIESFLSTFEYTLSPDSIPRSVKNSSDFLDWFLFESRKGYCSHFATAFVLMARKEGIPARYAQGFRVPAGPKGSVTVRSSMAHAWPEAYIDGTGWIRFEPAPGMGVYTGWGVSRRESSFYPGSDVGKALTENGTGPEETRELTAENEASFFGIQKLLIPAAAVLAFLVLFLIISFIISGIGFKRLDNNGRFRLICKKNIKLLGHLGIRMEQGETLEELGKRAEGVMGGLRLDFMTDYETVLYAGQKATGEMCLKAEADRRKLLENIRRKRGRLVAFALSF